MREIYAQTIPGLIDPDLEYLKRFDVHPHGRFGICLVRTGGQELILKWRVTANKRLIRREVETLRILGGLARTPELVRFYEGAARNQFTALLKTFTPGDTLETLFPDGPTPSKLYEPTRELVVGIHKRGVSGLDLNERNITLYDATTHLFDFDSTTLRSDSEEKFQEERRKDLRKLKETFSVS